MSTPFKVPDRNAPYRSTKTSYEGFWQSAGRERATTVPHPTISRFPQPFGFQIPTQQEPKTPTVQMSTQTKKPPLTRTQEDEKASQSAVIKQLAKKTKKQVREWFREQIETLDDSESD